MNQIGLFDEPPPRPKRPPKPPVFDGTTFDAKRDGERLGGELQAVHDYVRSGRWVTLAEISKAIGKPEASISARLRDLRKPRFGSHVIEREYVERGLWRYRMVR